jgi:hypothetical protein
MSASADVLAMAKVEVDLSTIAEGKNVRIQIGWSYHVGQADLRTGHYQMARKASFHPPQNRR